MSWHSWHPLTGHQENRPPTNTSVLPPTQPHHPRLHCTHTSKCHWCRSLLSTLPRVARKLKPRSEKRSPVQTKSRWARGRKWSTSVLRKWDTEAFGRSPRLRQNRKSTQWKTRSLKSLLCRVSNWLCKTPRRLCSGSRDPLWKGARVG